eukprot:GHUV01004511.1.p2 GENE.GHUV01004511.1~~GHUV01004511.1.p2  ORF type:complete len:145 (+),score=37.43 GHUV01004511.1:212-646(+)
MLAEEREVAQRLGHLKLDKPHVGSALEPCAVQHVQSAFGELFEISPSTLIQPVGGGDKEQEAKLWDCFAEVYEKELQQLQQSSKQELSTEKKRQILADILVWAEITQAHYDTKTTSFVTEPHGGDASFQRIGRLLKAAKKDRGL